MKKKLNKVCFLHIGIHKTGTTSIQTFSIANRDLLLQHGFLFPLSGCKVTEKNEYRAHHHIGWQLRGDPRYNPERGDLTALLKEAKQFDFPNLIVSSEDFLFLTHQPTLRNQLINTFKNAGYQIKIVLVLRPQAAHIFSLYTQLLANNTLMTFTFEEMLEKIITTGTFHFYRDEVYYSDYNKIIRSWKESQIDEVKVLTYEKNIIPSFLKSIGLDVKPLMTAAKNAKRANTSANKKPVYHLLLNNILQDKSLSELQISNFELSFTRLAKHLVFKEMNNLTWQLEVQKHFYQSNKLLAQLYQCYLNPKPYNIAINKIRNLFKKFSKPGGAHQRC